MKTEKCSIFLVFNQGRKKLIKVYNNVEEVDLNSFNATTVPITSLIYLPEGDNETTIKFKNRFKDHKEICISCNRYQKNFRQVALKEFREVLQNGKGKR